MGAADGAWVPRPCIVGRIPEGLCGTIFRIGAAGAPKGDHALDRDAVVVRVTFTNGFCHVAGTRLRASPGDDPRAGWGRAFSTATGQTAVDTLKAFAQHRGWWGAANGAALPPWTLQPNFAVDLLDDGHALLALPVASDGTARGTVLDPYSLTSFGPHAAMPFSGRLRTDHGWKVGVAVSYGSPPPAVTRDVLTTPRGTTAATTTPLPPRRGAEVGIRDGRVQAQAQASEGAQDAPETSPTDGGAAGAAAATLPSWLQIVEFPMAAAERRQRACERRVRMSDGAGVPPASSGNRQTNHTAPANTLAHDVLLTASHCVLFASAGWRPADVLADPGVALGAVAPGTMLNSVAPPSTAATSSEAGATVSGSASHFGAPPNPRGPREAASPNALVFIPRRRPGGLAAAAEPGGGAEKDVDVDEIRVLRVDGFISSFGGVISDVGYDVVFTAVVHPEREGVAGVMGGQHGVLQTIAVDLKRGRVEQRTATAALAQVDVVVHPQRTARPTRFHYTRGRDGVAKYDAVTGRAVLWRPPKGFTVADLLFIPTQPRGRHAAAPDALAEDDGYIYVQLNTPRGTRPRRTLITLLAPTTPAFTHHATIQCPEYIPPAFRSCHTTRTYLDRFVAQRQHRL